ncbi:hypothetical protein N7532_003767 [Penicillium argentinense]|uniref:Thioester reductase (TE) domain-containing protein n=1 Tax=Penicillium argentinense TaxID=1131581 RepID=A0A9W9FN29_9EURO|nr:uncharacterized protein N7532_003767 [Penicillium argentinense]KAJ5103238.1 hypothetical protein N7532_003767 [Penicillium argentinense]
MREVETGFLSGIWVQCHPRRTPEWLSEDERRVFMTPATGFIGVYFPARLLRQPSVKNVAYLVATIGRRKSFHFTSSIDAWGLNGLIVGTRKCLEVDTLEPNLKGLPYDIRYAATIYGPGFVIGDSKTGAGNPDDFFARLMVVSIQLGAFPHLPRQRIEYVTADNVCDAMLHIVFNNGNQGHSFSLVATDPSVNLEKTVEVINDAGHPVDRIPYWNCVKRLHAPMNVDNPLMPLMPLLQVKVWDAPDIGYVPFSPDQLNQFLASWKAKGFYGV